MQKFHSYLFLTMLVSLTACKAHEKKIIVYASSDITVDETKQHITVAAGTTHHEQELDFATGSPVTLDVQSPQGKLSISAADDGLYILNLKSDTVVGSLKHVGTTARDRVSQDELKRDIDSLRKLSMGQNVSEANRNFCIPPGKIVKVTGETNAKIFGPYMPIPHAFDPGSVPELYKFYNMSEFRELIDNLDKQTK